MRCRKKCLGQEDQLKGSVVIGGNLKWPGLPSAQSQERLHGEGRILAGAWRMVNLGCAHFPLLHNRWPLWSGLQTPPLCYLTVYGLWCGWLLCSGSQKAEVKVFPSAFSSARLPGSSSCWQGSVLYGGDTKVSRLSPKDHSQLLMAIFTSLPRGLLHLQSQWLRISRTSNAPHSLTLCLQEDLSLCSGVMRLDQAHWG